MNGSWKIESHSTGWIVTRRRDGRWESLVEHGGMLRVGVSDYLHEVLRSAYVFNSPTRASAAVARYDRAELLRS